MGVVHRKPLNFWWSAFDRKNRNAIGIVTGFKKFKTLLID
ncbi:hypothetical protein CKA32_001936 [Geitlerinema sp. FC II]|nr:hypothetical protein CKA32_001936 [Geitlerinema sp. FC II]